MFYIFDLDISYKKIKTDRIFPNAETNPLEANLTSSTGLIIEKTTKALIKRMH